MEKANENRDTEQAVAESSLQIVLQTLSGRYYCQLYQYEPLGLVIRTRMFFSQSQVI